VSNTAAPSATAAPAEPPAVRQPEIPASLHGTNQGRGGAVILHIVQAKAPDDVVVGLRHIKLGVAVSLSQWHCPQPGLPQQSR